MNKKGIAHVPGRICLAGEFLDWMTGPSIMCAIDLHITAVAETAIDKDSLVISSSNPYNIQQIISRDEIGHYTNHILDYAHAAYKVFIDHTRETDPVKISIKSNLPVEGGLSSSAAVTLATIASLSKLFKSNISNELLCQLAYQVEAKELKTGAGQMDYYSCTLGKMMFINCSTVPPNPIETYILPNDYCFVVVDTLTPRHASDVMHIKHEQYENKHPTIMEYISLAEATVNEIRRIFKSEPQSFEKIGPLITYSHYLNRDYLKISTVLLDKCVEIAINNGALGAKLTGAGTGGCMFALAHKKEAKFIAQKLSLLPVKVYITDASNIGLKSYLKSR